MACGAASEVRVILFFCLVEPRQAARPAQQQHRQQQQQQLPIVTVLKLPREREGWQLVVVIAALMPDRLPARLPACPCPHWHDPECTFHCELLRRLSLLLLPNFCLFTLTKCVLRQRGMRNEEWGTRNENENTSNNGNNNNNNRKLRCPSAVFVILPRTIRQFSFALHSPDLESTWRKGGGGIG